MCNNIGDLVYLCRVHHDTTMKISVRVLPIIHEVCDHESELQRNIKKKTREQI